MGNREQFDRYIGVISELKCFWTGSHRMESYSSFKPNAGMMLPLTEEVGESLFVLSTGTCFDECIINLFVTILLEKKL